jgi:hypothetical protein
MYFDRACPTAVFRGAARRPRDDAPGALYTVTQEGADEIERDGGASDFEITLRYDPARTTLLLCAPLHFEQARVDASASDRAPRFMKPRAYMEQARLDAGAFASFFPHPVQENFLPRWVDYSLRENSGRFVNILGENELVYSDGSSGVSDPHFATTISLASYWSLFYYPALTEPAGLWGFFDFHPASTGIHTSKYPVCLPSSTTLQARLPNAPLAGL